MNYKIILITGLLLLLPLFVHAQEPNFCLSCHDLSESPDQTWADLNERSQTAALARLVHTTHIADYSCGTCHLPDSRVRFGLIRLHLPPQAPKDMSSAAATHSPYCLDCHMNTEQADQIEGVCATCHAEPYPIEENASLTECVVCHAPTIAEWRTSAHGAQQLACDTCHFPHQDALRFQDVNALCLNCHDQPRTDFAHVMHLGQACSDCHIYQGEDAALHVVTGGAYMKSGHHNRVETQACVACHATGTEITQAGVDLAAHPIMQSAQRIETLSAEIDTIHTESSNEAALRFAQSMVVGLALGIFGTLTIRRIRSRQNKLATGEEDHDG